MFYRCIAIAIGVVESLWMRDT